MLYQPGGPARPGPEFNSESQSATKRIGATMTTSLIDSTETVNNARPFSRRGPEPKFVGLEVLLVDPEASRRDAISRVIAEVGGNARAMEIAALENGGELPN